MANSVGTATSGVLEGRYNALLCLIRVKWVDCLAEGTGHKIKIKSRIGYDG